MLCQTERKYKVRLTGIEQTFNFNIEHLCFVDEWSISMNTSSLTVRPFSWLPNIVWPDEGVSYSVCRLSVSLDIPLTINNPSELNPHPIWPQGANLPREVLTRISQSEASHDASWPMRGQTASQPPSIVPCDHSTLWCSTLPDNWIESVTNKKIRLDKAEHYV